MKNKLSSSKESNFTRWIAAFRKLAKTGLIRLEEIHTNGFDRIDVFFNGTWFGCMWLDTARSSESPKFYGGFGAEGKDFSTLQALRYLKGKAA